LASALVSDGYVNEITVAIALDRWWPAAGTRKTGERNTVPRVVVANGRVVPQVPLAEVPDWVLSALGHQTMLEVPLSEVVTLARHLDVGRVSVKVRLPQLIRPKLFQPLHAHGVRCFELLRKQRHA
jgi:hypothetical protein